MEKVRHISPNIIRYSKYEGEWKRTNMMESEHCIINPARLKYEGNGERRLR